MKDVNQKTLDFIMNLSSILDIDEEKIKSILSELRSYNKSMGLYADKEDCSVVKLNDVTALLSNHESDIIAKNDKFNIYKIDNIPIDSLINTDIPRVDAEYNPEYLQLVVGLILKCGDKLLLLNNTKGDMSNSITIIQGHVDKSDTNERLTDKLKNNLIREFFEEINTQDCSSKYLSFLNTCKPQLLIVPNEHNYSTISRFHMGIIYAMDVDEQSFYTIRSNEENNEITYYDINSFPMNSIEVFLDSWALNLINIIKV